MWNSSNPVEDWWYRYPSSNCQPFPGTTVLFVGAGISVDQPTGLPQGQPLTRALINLLLVPRAAEEIVYVFEKCAPVLGRNVPRLEHVLDVACNGSQISSPSPFSDPRNLLRLFANRRPNRIHRMIAKHLVEKRGWVITTNFDDCIETAFFEATGQRLPVHVLNRDTPTKLEVLHGSPNEGWGLVKPHGTIEQGVDALAATLRDLVPRLPIPFRELFNQIFDSADLIIVAGYSGSDHFDVNAWIRERLNNRNKPRLFWLKHGDADASDVVGNEEKMEPRLSWMYACGGLRELYGVTIDHLAKLLHQECPSESLDGLIEEAPLSERLRALHMPTDDKRHLNGARFCIAIGLGQLAEEELRQFNHRKADNEMEITLLPEVYACMGLFPDARGLFAWLRCHAGEPATLQRAKLFGRESHPLRGLIGIIGSSFRAGHHKLSASEKIELRFEAIECFLDFAEAAQHFAPFRIKPLRWLCESITLACWPSSCAVTPENVSLALEGKAQILALRGKVLFDDDYLSLCLLLKEQFSAPELWGESGPAIPGGFLVGISTCKEEDRLADLVEMKLIFARILLSAIRRKWSKDQASRAKGIDWARDAHVGLFQHFLSLADEVAHALDEPHLLVAVSKCRVMADKVLPYWRGQRLYLGG